MNCTILAQDAAPAPTADPNTPQGPASFLSNPMVMVFVVIILFWVLIMRPQKKREKEQQERINAIKKGDKVITNAGIHGTVVYVDDNTVNVQVADNVTIKFEKMAVAHVQKKNQDADVAKS